MYAGIQGPYLMAVLNIILASVLELSPKNIVIFLFSFDGNIYQGVDVICVPTYWQCQYVNQCRP